MRIQNVYVLCYIELFIKNFSGRNPELVCTKPKHINCSLFAGRTNLDKDQHSVILGQMTLVLIFLKRKKKSPALLARDFTGSQIPTVMDMYRHKLMKNIKNNDFISPHMVISKKTQIR